MTRTWKRFEKTMGPARDAHPSQSVLGYMIEQELNAEQQKLVRMIVEGYHAAPLDDVSASSIGADAASAGADFEQYRVTTGYTIVLSLLEHGIVRERAHIELAARVRRVEWTPDSVKLTLELRGEPAEVRAHKCLITASVGVLRAPLGEGGIAISPLPPRISEGLSAIGMGHVMKVVFRFERPPWRHERALVEASFVHLPKGAFATFWRHAQADQEQVTAWAAGPAALALCRLDGGALYDTALRNLALAFAVEPAACRRALVEVHHHDFSNDPAFRGAYSYQRPGRSDAHSAFAPVEDTLFFAGEALDLQYPATVAGALGSGQHVARQIVASCRKRDHEPGRKVG
jgi:monoamine oxidase